MIDYTKNLVTKWFGEVARTELPKFVVPTEGYVVIPKSIAGLEFEDVDAELACLLEFLGTAYRDLIMNRVDGKSFRHYMDTLFEYIGEMWLHKRLCGDDAIEELDDMRLELEDLMEHIVPQGCFFGSLPECEDVGFYTYFHADQVRTEIDAREHRNLLISAGVESLFRDANAASVVVVVDGKLSAFARHEFEEEEDYEPTV